MCGESLSQFSRGKLSPLVDHQNPLSLTDQPFSTHGAWVLFLWRGPLNRYVELVYYPSALYSGREQFVHFVRIGNRALNLDRVTHCEVQVWHDAVSVKIYMTGMANNTPVVLNEEEAKEFWKYIEYVAEKPV